MDAKEILDLAKGAYRDTIITGRVLRDVGLGYCYYRDGVPQWDSTTTKTRLGEMDILYHMHPDGWIPIEGELLKDEPFEPDPSRISASSISLPVYAPRDSPDMPLTRIGSNVERSTTLANRIAVYRVLTDEEKPEIEALMRSFLSSSGMRGDMCHITFT